MSMESALYEYLVAQAAVTALISDRLFPNVAPAKTCSPYATYSLIVGVPEHHLGAAAGLTRSTFQITAWADTYLEAVALGDAIIGELDGMRNQTLGTTTPVAVKSVAVGAIRDTIDGPTAGEEAPAYGRQIDIDVWHVTSVPTF